MYFLINQAIELSCDEAVVRIFGTGSKSLYARTLISMEETKSGLSTLHNSFSKNTIEKRVTAIMKIKKTSFTTILAAIALVAGVTIAFTTSATSEKGVSTSDDKNQQMAFGKVLWDIYQRGILPNGSSLEYMGMESAATNSFALIDLDSDGREELLLLWETASMAGMKGYVFSYGDGEVYEELQAFPSLKFFDNGIVIANWSHNQGLAGDFWPYFIYRYDADNDAYQNLGGVDAWNKRVREKNENGDCFPTDIDADGDGVVYFILPTDWNGQYDLPIVDGSDYKKWWNSYMEGAKELNIPFQKLTEENIAALGYPKPEVQIPEPVG